MDSDRQIIVDQILKAIDYGNLPRDEIERRLEQIIETELNVPFSAEINKEKVDLCNSLLRRLYMQSPIIDKADIEESKEKVRKRVNAYRRRRNILWTAVRSIAAALILVVGLTLLNVIPPIRWFTGTSTDDEQQYIVQGHEISTQSIASAISEHNESGVFSTQSNKAVNEYLGFVIDFPDKIGIDYLASEYDVAISPINIRASCSYRDISRGSDNTDIVLSLVLYSNLEDSYLWLEQDNDGEEVVIKDSLVYLYVNTNRKNYVWSKDNVVYRLSHTLPISISENEIENIVCWRYFK